MYIFPHPNSHHPEEVATNCEPVRIPHSPRRNTLHCYAGVCKPQITHTVLLVDKQINVSNKQVVRVSELSLMADFVSLVYSPCHRHFKMHDGLFDQSNVHSVPLHSLATIRKSHSRSSQQEFTDVVVSLVLSIIGMGIMPANVVQCASLAYLLLFYTIPICSLWDSLDFSFE